MKVQVLALILPPSIFWPQIFTFTFHLHPSSLILHPSSFVEGIVYDRLRFVHDRIEVGLVLKTLRIDFVDVLGARGPGGKPPVGSHHLEATNRCAVTRCRG